MYANLFIKKLTILYNNKIVIQTPIKGINE